MAHIDDIREALKINPKNLKLLKELDAEKEAKKKRHKGMGGAYKKNASGGVIRLKSGGPVVDSYDYN